MLCDGLYLTSNKLAGVWVKKKPVHTMAWMGTGHADQAEKVRKEIIFGDVKDLMICSDLSKN